MTPELEQRLPVARPLAQPAKSASQSPVSDDGDDDGLNPPPQDQTSAHDFQAAPVPNARRHRATASLPRVKPGFAILVALLVGGGFAAFLPLSYRNTCTFSLAPRSDIDLPQVRAALLEFLWANAKPDLGAWQVLSTAGSHVAFTIVTSGSPKPAEIERLGAEFIQSLGRSLAEQVAPTESEQYLTRLLADAQHRLQDASTAAGEASPASGSDPRARRDRSIGDRSQLAARYAQASSAWSHAEERLGGLTAAGAPTEGTIDPDVRLHAQQADQTLQQDLRELNVRLTEFRAELISSIQQASDKLSPLEDAVHALLSLLQDQEPSADLAVSAGSTGLQKSAENYLRLYAAFAERFAAAARTAESIAPDPLRDDLLDAYTALRKLTSDFLFDASKLLTAMRTQVDAFNEGDAAAPRNYQFASDAARAFGQVQTAHHRFEFAAAKIDSAGNFRLDSALRSSRGLRSRTRDRLAAIEDSLAAEALGRAREQYAMDLVEAEAEHRAARAEVDAAVAELLEADESVLASIGPSDEFLEAVIRRELAAAAAADRRGQIVQMQEVLDRLAARRQALTEAPVVSLKSVEASLAPHDLRRRLTISGIASAIALLSILLGQWRLTRSR